MGLLMMLLWSPPSFGIAATFYVDQNHVNANDANAGTSEAAPWRTLPRAMASDIVAGDIVYVKNGTYVDTSPAELSNPTPKFSPANSGRSDAPIAIRAYTPSTGPRHRPVVGRNLSTAAGENSPVIGANTRDYIVWDGFTLARGTDIGIWYCTGCVVENMVIDKGPPPVPWNGTGNYDGIRVEVASGTLIRNNIIRNVYYVGSTHSNAAAIKLYSTNNTRISNNEISYSNTAIKDKQNGISNVFERNYIHHIYGLAIEFTANSSPRCGACPVQNIAIRNNIIAGGEMGIYLNLGSGTEDQNVDAYNNVMYDVTQGFGMYGAVRDIDVYNNIIVARASGNSAQINLTNIPSDWTSNYNDFQVMSGGTISFTAPTGPETLSQWLTRGYDPNSSTTAPLFVGPLTDITPATAFRLQTVSPLINAGRTGGVSSGAPVNMGAYLSDVDVIGLRTDLDTIAPSRPSGLVVR